MKASYYVSEGKFDIKDVNAVEPQADEVMLRMAYCGICGTDMHIFHGKMDKRIRPASRFRRHLFHSRSPFFLYYNIRVYSCQ
jgi:threonine dehydrogenase-like Zn-dependent dehydrogenase